MLMKRGSGILLHITSLPSPFGVGDFGPDAYRFVDFLVETKQSYWQILPLTPTNLAHGSSPYGSISVFAGNPLLISPVLMAKDGLLTKEEISPLVNFPVNQVDYNKVSNYKKHIFQIAYERFGNIKINPGYENFCSKNSYWLDDYALFVACKTYFHEQMWNEWPTEIRDRQSKTLRSLKNELYNEIEREKFIQYIFLKQWLSLKKYCNKKGIQVIGDIPIYISYDSVDLWSNPEIFKLDKEKRPYVVAGVPPDYFSKTGQLWGNPVYNWKVLKERGYDWWIKRVEHYLKLFDFIRFDHFRGFVAYWEVPAEETTAVNGNWIKAPAKDFFDILNKRFPYLPIIAEDLGVITPDVIEVMNRYGFPGMKVLLFAFDEGFQKNPYIPHNVVRNCVFYTGTHDNNTIRGWFEREAKPDDIRRLFSYIGREVPLEELNWELIRLVMMSVADTVLFPMQDILGLGEEARMNRPATSKGNWLWRLSPDEITLSLKLKLKEMTEIYGRV
ncbi:4-alpha-glucanotransferase [candidate division WOR-3 bacterium]|nr:4-alpha-glucanotransferase [candidate division WOR-3 bacterium]